MRKDMIPMSQKERQRYHLLQMLLESKTTLKEASRLMGVSYRHAKRLKRKLISEEAAMRAGFRFILNVVLDEETRPVAIYGASQRPHLQTGIGSSKIIYGARSTSI
jgi:nickel-dependent lactate racemase